MMDDEHKLISRYAERLKSVANRQEDSSSSDYLSKRHLLVKELEAKNREIQLEIQRLRFQQQQQPAILAIDGFSDEALVAEIRQLRQHHDELERRMQHLQDSRDELMQQLDGLMKRLKFSYAPSPINSPSFLRHPSNNSVCNETTSNGRPSSTGLQNGSHNKDLADKLNTKLSLLHNDVTASSPTSNDLHHDLMHATDGVTNAVSSLVHTLNIETDQKH